MSALNKLVGALNPEVSSFTKLLMRKRSGMQIGPNGSAQGFLYGIGLGNAGDSASPEATLSRVLKEWVRLKQWPVESQISVLESRTMGNKHVAPDSITTIEEWLAWRLELEFPNHRIRESDGWTKEYFSWACSRALEHF
jgi:hypothetical protein